MKYTPIMEKLDLPAKEELLRWDPKALILSEEKAFRQRVIEVFWRAEADESQVILLSGPTSSGKTTASRILAEGLTRGGNRAVRIALDDFYKDRSQAPLWEDGQKNFETIDGLDLDTLGECMEDLLATGHTKVPIFDFASGTRSPLSRDLTFDDRSCLIFEGLHALNPRMAAAILPEKQFRIYISALTQLAIDQHNPIPPEDGRLLRRIVRDARTRGYSAEQTMEMWPAVRTGEEVNILPFQENADVFFNSACVYELAVLKQYAEPLLFDIQPSSLHYEEARRLLKFLDYFLGISSEDIPKNSLLREFIG